MMDDKDKRITRPKVSKKVPPEVTWQFNSDDDETNNSLECAFLYYTDYALSFNPECLEMTVLYKITAAKLSKKVPLETTVL